MNQNEILESIADKNVDINRYSSRICEDKDLRNLIVENMISNKSIMVYYHCYYIVSKACEENPELFYEYWSDFVALMDHENSYHRDFGITLVASLTKVDKGDLFKHVRTKYYERINDEKFMTTESFVRSLSKVIQFKKAYVDEVIELLLDVDRQADFPEKQMALLKGYIIQVFDTIYSESKHQAEIDVFVKKQLHSMSPKSRKIAKLFIAKYDV